MARRRRGLSAEDRALWERVTATATPLVKDRKSNTQAPVKEQKSQKVRSVPDRKLSDFRIGNAPTPELAHMLAPSVAEHVNGAPVRMHHGTHKKMVRGKITPEARIDLHGMTLARAHPVLTRFIQNAHAAGKRLVLVITGKGRDRDDDGPIPIRRGVLRHQVPAWLQSPPLGAVVLDIRTAHLKHGGDGAYYVYLKR
ncbi:MAG: Smr/MutS family protein [Pseudomonadota bacterium]